MATRVVVDAGHGGWDNGAMFNGRKEKDDNLNLALKVGEILLKNFRKNLNLLESICTN